MTEPPSRIAEDVPEGEDPFLPLGGAVVTNDDGEILQIEAYHVIRDCRTVAMQLDIRYDYTVNNGLCDELVGDTVTIDGLWYIRTLRDRLDDVIVLVGNRRDGLYSERSNGMSMVLMDGSPALIILRCESQTDTFSLYVHRFDSVLGVPTLDPLVSDEPYAMVVEDPDGTVLTEFLTAWRDECDKCLEARL